MVMRLLLGLLALWAVACTPARRWAPGEDVVRRIRFDGNGGPASGHSDWDLRSSMAQKGTQFGLLLWPLTFTHRPHVLDPVALDADKERIRTFYAHRGWFESAFVDWELVRRREASVRRAGVVDLVGRVVPGPATKVRSVTISGLGPATGIFGDVVLRTGPVREGDPFSLEGAAAMRDLLVSRLKDSGYPYAVGDFSAEVYQDERAVDLLVTVEPGKLATVGPVTVSGLLRVPEGAVRSALPFDTGDNWKQTRLAETRRRLSDLGVFSVSAVQANLSDPERTEVPVEVRLAEGRFRRLRVSGGVEFDGAQFAPRLTAAFRHANVGRRVIRMDLTTSVGATTSFDATGAEALFPTYSAELAFRWPRLGGKELWLETKGGVVQDVQSGLFGYRQPSASITLRAEPTRNLSASFGPGFTQYDYLLDSVPQRQAARSSFGADFQNPYQLAYLDQGLALDRRDDRTHGRRGTYSALSFREAIPLGSGDYAFFGATAEMRGYIPIRLGYRGFPLVAVLTAKAEWVEPLNDQGIPYPEQIFLGGASDLRGFRTDQVGPYETLCSEDPFALLGEGDHLYLPRGGTSAWLASAEFRYDLRSGLRLATFVDAGMLAPQGGALSADLLRASAGVGTRYDTAVGPIRFDLSFRPLYPEDQGPADVIDCVVGEANARVSDFFSAFPAWRATESHPPFAMVFYLVIGEAR